MTNKWTTSNPEAEGMDGGVLHGIDDYIRQKSYRLVNSVLVVKNGKIVFERYYNQFDDTTRNNIKSVWKSIVSIIVGISLDKGYIRSLDEPVKTYLPEFAKNIHPYHKRITIRHLLTMTSGIYWHGGVHYHCPMVEQMKRTRDWTAHMADLPVSSVPGTKFEYKEWDVMLLSAVISRAHNRSAYDIAEEYLYTPLDISSGVWPESPCGFSYTVMRGEQNSDLSARDLAKIGLLFQNGGLSNDKRIVAQEYINLAISPSYNNPSYGYLWWIFPDGYGCRGFGGQEINVLPEANFISVIQATPTRSSKSYGDIHNIVKQAIR